MFDLWGGLILFTFMDISRLLSIVALLFSGVTAAGVTVHTSDTYGYTSLYTYGIDALSRDHIVFAVKACAHAHTALMSDQTDSTGTQYEIGIGGWGNERSFIRSEPQGTALIFYYSAEMDCNQFKIFWIKWSNGVISAGRGITADQNKFMEYDFGTLNPINYLAVSTGWGETGEWLYNIEAPSLTSTSTTVYEGTNVNLPCYTGGFPTPTVTWYKGATQLPGGDPDVTVLSNGDLSINNALPSHTGTYTCKAENIVDTRQLTSTLTVQAIIDGAWSTWGTWGSCSVTCGTGAKSRTRSCTNPPPSGGGQICSGSSNEATSCSAGTCDVDGDWSQWGAWSTCSVTCGGGDKQRTRTCTDPAPVGNGNPCAGNGTDSADCNTNNCPIDGSWSIWSALSSCNATCGGGTQFKTRTCTSPSPAYGGTDCPGSNIFLQDCNTHDCPVDGSWSQWSAWSVCTVTCGGGDSQRTRSCTDPVPVGAGLPCSGNDTEYTDCNTNNCPVDGSWAAWGVFSVCNATCGGGTQYKTRSCSTPAPAYGGAACPGSDTLIQSCNTHNCTDPADAVGCDCQCQDSLLNITLEEKLEQLRTYLAVNKSLLSSTRRKLISVGDHRPSAQRIGYVGVVLLCMTLVLLTVADVKAVLFHFVTRLPIIRKAKVEK